jgi:hypothetical protein
LFSSCGQGTPAIAGLCMSCYRRRQYSARFFGGIHHRHPGDHTQLVTLCAGCHARVHRTGVLRHWLPEILVDLWREWHPDAVEQLRLPVEMSAGVPATGGWQIMSDFPGRVVAGPLPEDEPDGGGKQCRIFLPDPAQFRFEWAAETAEGGQEGARAG